MCTLFLKWQHPVHLNWIAPSRLRYHQQPRLWTRGWLQSNPMCLMPLPQLVPSWKQSRTSRRKLLVLPQMQLSYWAMPVPELVVSQMNKALLPLAEEDSNFGEVSSSLIGLEFAKKSKQSEGYEVHPWHVQAVFSTRPPQQSGRWGVTLTSRHEEGEESREDGQAKENHSRRTLGTSDSCTHLYKKCDNELEKYPIEPDCMSCSRTVPSTRPATSRLAHYLANWSTITQDQWVLNTAWVMILP